MSTPETSVAIENKNNSPCQGLSADVTPAPNKAVENKTAREFKTLDAN